VRSAKPNPKVKLKTQLVFMWKRELRLLLKVNRLGIYEKGSRRTMERALLTFVPRDVLKKQMCYMLFERDYSIFEKDSE
jgi:hypothetical protein